MITLLITIIAIAVAIWLVFMLLDYIGIPAPFNKIAKVIIILIAVIYLLKALTPLLNI